MIFTSYFAQLRYIPDSVKPIAISNSTPKGVDIDGISMLAPAWVYVSALKNELITREEFKEKYREQLDSLNMDALRQRIPEGDVVLVCYEKDPTQCHRSILAEWLRERMGYDVKEWRT